MPQDLVETEVGRPVPVRAPASHEWMPDFLRRFLGKPAYCLIAFLLLVLAFVAIFGPWIVPYDPLDVQIRDKLSPPSAEHWLGTDSLGRDQLSRLMIGARTSLGIASMVLVLSVAVGGLLGVIAGYTGGPIDEAIMRVADVFLAFPALILALSITAVLGPNLTNAMLAISISWWPWYARLVRGLALSIKENEYILAARCIGAPSWRIMLVHIMPNLTTPVIVQATLDMGAALITASALSFIGMGVQPPDPEWGAMINEGRQYVYVAPWLGIFPGLAIFGTVYLFNALGEAINRTMSRMDLT
jgi:peptide/nickel transport system permease protein